MLTLSAFGTSLGFAAPWALAALATIPLLWWLLRLMPPAPKRETFPALRLLARLKPPETTPRHTPWWLILLRAVIIAAFALGLARPVWNPSKTELQGDTLLLVIDDGWSAAPSWPSRQAAVYQALGEAERADQSVRLLTTAPTPDGAPLEVTALMTASDAKARLRTLEPKPWPIDYAQAATAITRGDALDMRVIWVADGLDHPARLEFANALASQSRGLTIDLPLAITLPHAIAPARDMGETAQLQVRILRPSPNAAPEGAVIAHGRDGAALGRFPYQFETGIDDIALTIELPPAWRNDLNALALETQTSAGAVFLIDERWRRRTVGLVSNERAEQRQPLLSDLYYIEKALEPHAALREGSLEALLDEGLSMIVLANLGALDAASEGRAAQWVEEGGVLLRFAGRQWGGEQDSLLPTRLRMQGRALGGAMTWGEALTLAPFADSSPFAGLVVPPDVRVARQLLAEPGPDLAQRTWASLADGTPLVTAAPRGKGWVILVHTSANADWTNLPLSGLFPAMLQRLVAFSPGAESHTARTIEDRLAPVSLLDGFGREGARWPRAVALAAGDSMKAKPSPDHPPGRYGRSFGQTAFNLGTSLDDDFRAAQDWPANATLRQGIEAGENDLAPYLLGFAAALLLLDMALGLMLRGLGPVRHRQKALAAALFFILVAFVDDYAVAQARNDLAAQASLNVRLAYLRTGQADIDRLSEAGLQGLTRVLRQRTSVEPDPPVGVDPARDDLSIYPFLYWPITGREASLAPEAQRRLREFMRTGGLILIDTRDPLTGVGAIGRNPHLGRLLAPLEIPPLAVMPSDHVLTRTFYLLPSWPGRHGQGDLWIEAAGRSANDNVSAVIIGSQDWAAAWAVDGQGRPLITLSGGDGLRQRELAWRFGVNLVMYALTGNYKTDQVHIPALLERLGQ